MEDLLLELDLKLKHDLRTPDDFRGYDEYFAELQEKLEHNFMTTLPVEWVGEHGDMITIIFRLKSPYERTNMEIMTSNELGRLIKEVEHYIDNIVTSWTMSITD